MPALPMWDEQLAGDVDRVVAEASRARYHFAWTLQLLEPPTRSFAARKLISIADARDVVLAYIATRANPQLAAARQLPSIRRRH